LKHTKRGLVGKNLDGGGFLGEKVLAVSEIHGGGGDSWNRVLFRGRGGGKMLGMGVGVGKKHR